MTVSLVSVCKYKGKCEFKHVKHNAHHHTLKNKLILCDWKGRCNQKETLTAQEASKKYGIPKNA